MVTQPLGDVIIKAGVVEVEVEGGRPISLTEVLACRPPPILSYPSCPLIVELPELLVASLLHGWERGWVSAHLIELIFGYF